MPLPAPKSDWPAPALADLLPTFRRWSAWYSGDPAQLTDAYGGSSVRQQLDRPVQFAGGLVGKAARVLWGNPVQDDIDDDRVHVPLASDLCAATAELCYSDPPQFAGADSALGRVAEYIEDGLLVSLAGGVELGAVFGGRYVQALIPQGAERARFEQLAYDGAWPVFRSGELVAVAFWWVLETDSTGRVWRHFESHELDARGYGIIRHALYLGTSSKVGQRMDLSSRDETRGLIRDPATTGNGYEIELPTGSPGLDVVHIPGRAPQRLWRRHPIGRSLGRSVLQGNEGMLSKLDETMTSWMRDVDLGRSRLILADWLLDLTKKGAGPSFDLDRRLITQVAMPQQFGQGGFDPIRQIQFPIRVAEHRETCQELTETILRASSFSATTFGEDENGNAQTATGVLSKDSRSMRTRAHVLNLERPQVQRIIRKALAMDQAAGLGPVQDDQLTVSFPDGSQDSPLQLAETQQAMRLAEAASDFTIVRYGHPDWTDQQVLDEVAAIRTGVAARANLDATTLTTFPPDDDQE